jgi:SIR2-like domain
MATPPVSPPPGPTAATTTLEQVLARFEGSFADFAAAVARGQYAFWLGSAISRDRVPPLRDVVLSVIANVQSRISPHDPNCRFRAVLDRILWLINFSAADRTRNDIAQPVASWPDRDDIGDRLVLQYARLLDIQVPGEGPDFLLWEALGVVATYADPAVEPDSEHLCIAGLIAEGAALTLVSANWDGLIEKAVAELIGPAASFNVYVRPEETRRPPERANLYKPHGCAVLAGQNAPLYRERLIARKSQIDRFITDQANQLLVQRLIDIAATKESLIIGLSLQDSNLQSVFAAAQQRMQWQYPSVPPAIVIAGSEIGFDQEGLLQNVYLDQYSAANREAIMQSALFTAYAKIFLLSLFVYVLYAKLATLMQIATDGWPVASQERLRTGIRALRTKLARAGMGVDPRRLTDTVLKFCTRTLCLFREGAEPELGSPRYRAISQTPTHQLATEALLPGTGLPGLGLGLALLGLGEDLGLWTIQEPDLTATRPGVLHVTADGSTTEVFLASDAEAVSNLIRDGLLDSTDPAILIHSREVGPRMARNPTGVYGRSGDPEMREVSLGEILAASGDVDELLTRFREEIGA